MSGRRGIIPFLPSAFTLGNLMCGFLAMAKAADALQLAGAEGTRDPEFARMVLHGCWFVAAAMLFDAVDGALARLIQQASPFGAVLDSLADMVTFGVAPAFLAKVVCEHTFRTLEVTYKPGLVTLLCGLYVIGTALRLARFTAASEPEEEDHQAFTGLPSPAAAGTVVSACFFIFGGTLEIGLEPALARQVSDWLSRGLPVLACGLGLLMVSHVRYVHLAQRIFGQRMRTATFVRLVLLVWVLLFFHEWSLFACALLYVLGGLLLALRSRLRGKGAAAPEAPAEEDGP